MEGLGAEVTQKIKSAIQAKLMELGVYVDDELPDYVMVMIGNKRSKALMEKDLKLFLDENTVPFTNWLYQVLQKLQEVTIANNKGKTEKPDKPEQPNLKEKTPSLDDEEFINIGEETDGDLLGDEVLEKNDTAEKIVDPLSTDSAKKKEKSHENENDRDGKQRDAKTKPDDRVYHTKQRITHETIRPQTNDADLRAIKVDRSRTRSRSPIRKKPDKVFDARELINRKKAEKRRRDISPEQKNSSKRLAVDSTSGDENAALKSSVHRTVLRRKYMVDEDDGTNRSGRITSKEKNDHLRNSGSKSKTDDRNLSNLPERQKNSIQSWVSANPKEKINRETERDGGVSSVVKITPRPRRPASQQPSSSLILKAVADANKSLASAPHRSLAKATRLDRQNQLVQKKFSPEKLSVTLQNVQALSAIKDNPDTRSVGSKNDMEINGNEGVGERNGRVKGNSCVGSNSKRDAGSTLTGAEDKGKDVQEAIYDWLQDIDNSNKVPEAVNCNDERLASSQETDVESVLEICQNLSDLEEDEEEPEFVVTLNGIDPEVYNESVCSPNYDDCEMDDPFQKNLHPERSIANRLRANKDHHNNSYDYSNVNQDNLGSFGWKADGSGLKEFTYNEEVNIPDSVNSALNAMKLKNLERCKFWPSCLLGEKCSYHHPSVACKTFPACKFGENCLYIHPPCKFGILCARRDCNYRHTASIGGKPFKPNYSISPAPLLYCRFFPNCTNSNCQFYHPKQPCKFGVFCAKKDCPFEHVKGLAQLNKLKWTKDMQQPAEVVNQQ